MDAERNLLQFTAGHRETERNRLSFSLARSGSNLSQLPDLSIFWLLNVPNWEEHKNDFPKVALSVVYRARMIISSINFPIPSEVRSGIGDLGCIQELLWLKNH
jgi:hypothetical protein